MSDRDRSVPHIRDVPGGLRLDAWKGIAAYLGKSDRTVKRWEAERELPVHRMPGSGHGSVYAWAAELDAWLLSGRGAGADLDADETVVADETEPVASAEVTIASLPDGGALLLHAGSAGRTTPVDTGRRTLPKRARWLFPTVIAGAVLLGVAAGLLGFLPSSALRHLPPAAVSSTASVAEAQKARELYLSGRYEWNQRTAESLNHALDDFTEAIVHDPNDARAYAGLADTYNLLREFGAMPDSEAYARSLAAAQKAVTLDPSLPEGHRALAFVEFWSQWDFVNAEHEFERAIELNPRDALTRLWFANAMAGPGWYQDSLRQIDRARELDPASLTILVDRASLVYNVGRHDEALNTLKQLEESNPAYVSIHRCMGRFEYLDGDDPGYLRELGFEAKLTKDRILEEAASAGQAGYHRGKRPEMNRRIYLALKSHYTQGGVSTFDMALASLRTGRKDEAIALLRGAWERRDPSFIYVWKRSWELGDFTADPRFKELLAKLAIPAPDAAALAGLDRR